MRKLNVEVLPNELADMIEDADGGIKGHMEPDQALDFAEFIGLMSRKLNDPHAKNELQDAFQVFDADGNGFISARELCNVMNNLGIDLPNDDGTPMSEGDVEDLICDWGPPDPHTGRRERKPGMSWDRFWGEIQGGSDGFGKKKKKKGRSTETEATAKLLKRAQVELQGAKKDFDARQGRYDDELEEAFAAREQEAKSKVDECEANYEKLKRDSEEDDEELTVTRLDLKRFAAQDNLGTHDAVRLGVGVSTQAIDKQSAVVCDFWVDSERFLVFIAGGGEDREDDVDALVLREAVFNDGRGADGPAALDPSGGRNWDGQDRRDRPRRDQGCTTGV